MNEKLPPFQRPEPKIIGSASPEKKEEIKKQILENFGEKHYQQMPDEGRELLEVLEYEKKPYEKMAIAQINELTNNLLREFGLTAFDIPEQNIHIIPDKLFKEAVGEKNETSTAITYQEKRQIIILNAEKNTNPIERISVLLHEIIHLKNYLAIKAEENYYSFYRHGLKMAPSFKKEEEIGEFEMFHAFNEAIVSEIEKQHSMQIFKENKFLKEEYNWQTSTKADKSKTEIARDMNRNSDEIMLITKDEKTIRCFSYYEPRRVLYYIVNCIYDENKNKFASKDEIMKLFFKAHFSGQLFNIARLIKKSFGPDAFRIIGMMDTTANSARSTMNYLIKKYRQHKR